MKFLLDASMLLASTEMVLLTEDRIFQNYESRQDLWFFWLSC
jgi:hypothetical protein